MENKITNNNQFHVESIEDNIVFRLLQNGTSSLIGIKGSIPNIIKSRNITCKTDKVISYLNILSSQLDILYKQNESNLNLLTQIPEIIKNYQIEKNIDKAWIEINGFLQRFKLNKLSRKDLQKGSSLLVALRENYDYIAETEYRLNEQYKIIIASEFLLALTKNCERIIIEQRINTVIQRNKKILELIYKKIDNNCGSLKKYLLSEYVKSSNINELTDLSALKVEFSDTKMTTQTKRIEYNCVYEKPVDPYNDHGNHNFDITLRIKVCQYRDETISVIDQGWLTNQNFTKSEIDKLKNTIKKDVIDYTDIDILTNEMIYYYNMLNNESNQLIDSNETIQKSELNFVELIKKQYFNISEFN